MRFGVEELVPEFVAQIRDFPFDAMDDEAMRELRQVWTKYPVLRFRNVRIDDARQVEFTKGLGPIFHSRNVTSGKHSGFPEILVVANRKNPDGTPAGDLGDGEVRWHTDHWWIEVPPSAAILRAIEVPPSGGNTCFANMYAAYASLPESTQARVRGKYIHHQDVLDSFGKPRLGREMPSCADVAAWPGVDHPIVRRHGDSGKPCLYLGSGRPWQAIVGMDRGPAGELLDELWACATDARHVWCQQWRTDDMIIWDNRCLMHRRDAFDPASQRLMHRTTVAGERPLAAN